MDVIRRLLNNSNAIGDGLRAIKLDNIATQTERDLRTLVNGYPPDQLPDNAREVLVQLPQGQRALGCYFRSQPAPGWRVNGVFCDSVVRWWELP